LESEKKKSKGSGGSNNNPQQRKGCSSEKKYTKADYDRMLQCKMGEKIFKNEGKGQKIYALKTLWELYKHVNVVSIVLPE
jgi:hypothetical protein